MKLTFKDTTVTFKDLRNGQTFIDPEIDDCTVFIKVFPNCLELEVKTDVDIVGEEYTGFAVDLYTGEICGYHDTDDVVPVEVEATVKR